jgi:hypothetical protein
MNCDLTDISVSGPFEHYCDEQWLLFCNHSTDRTLNKQRYGKIPTEARDKTVKQANNKAGFRAISTYPFKPSFISEEELAPSLIIYKKDVCLQLCETD